MTRSVLLRKYPEDSRPVSTEKLWPGVEFSLAFTSNEGKEERPGSLEKARIFARPCLLFRVVDRGADDRPEVDEGGNRPG